MRIAHDPRLAFVVGDEVVVQVRDFTADRSHNGEADQVGEADLAAPNPAQVIVEDLAVDFEQLGGDLAKACCCRDLEARFHIGHDSGRHTA